MYPERGEKRLKLEQAFTGYKLHKQSRKNEQKPARSVGLTGLNSGLFDMVFSTGLDMSVRLKTSSQF